MKYISGSFEILDLNAAIQQVVVSFESEQASKVLTLAS